MPGWTWDPFVVLWLPHDLHLRSGQVRRAYRARLRGLDLFTDPDERRIQEWRLPVAYGVLRTRAQRRQVLADLTLRPDWDRSFTHPDVQAQVDALIPPLPQLMESGLDLEEALDRRALARTTAQMRLERAATGVLAWPRTRLGRAWARTRYDWPG